MKGYTVTDECRNCADGIYDDGELGPGRPCWVHDSTGLHACGDRAAAVTPEELAEEDEEPTYAEPA